MPAMPGATSQELRQPRLHLPRRARQREGDECRWSQWSEQNSAVTAAHSYRGYLCCCSGFVGFKEGRSGETGRHAFGGFNAGAAARLLL